MAIAPYRNPPIEPQYYAPRQYDIANLTLGVNTIVTTTVNHDYMIGQQIRLLIPEFYGSRQLNEQTGYVIAIPALNQVTTTINSTNANIFISSPSFTNQVAQIVAIGDVNSGIINTSGIINNVTFVPGSFINISPN